MFINKTVKRLKRLFRLNSSISVTQEFKPYSLNTIKFALKEWQWQEREKQ